jgi:hypothetical protein
MFFVVQEGATNKTGVVAAHSQYALSWSIIGAAYHNSNEVHLTSCNHVAYARYAIEHTTNVLVSNLLLFDSRHGYMQDSADIAVEEYF